MLGLSEAGSVEKWVEYGGLVIVGMLNRVPLPFPRDPEHAYLAARCANIGVQTSVL